MSMTMHLPEFRELHRYYTTRDKNPLKGKQSKVALCCKVIRVFYTLLKKGVEYDSQKLMKDIVRPDLIAAQEKARKILTGKASSKEPEKIYNEKEK